MVVSGLEPILYGIGSLYWLGIEASTKRILPETSEDDEHPLKKREMGEPLIPFFRGDVSYQDVESDVVAIDSRIELGYGPLGLQGRWTHYDEEVPDDQLELVQVHGLLRASYGDSVGLDFGLGGMFLSGTKVQSGVSLTTPLLIHPWKLLGFEFRPAWGFINNSNIQDYDLGVRLGWSYLGLRVGYRWVNSENASLHGPYWGGSLYF